MLCDVMENIDVKTRLQKKKKKKNRYCSDENKEGKKDMRRPGNIDDGRGGARRSADPYNKGLPPAPTARRRLITGNYLLTGMLSPPQFHSCVLVPLWRH